MLYSEKIDVVDMAYQIIGLYEENVELRRQLDFMTQQRDQWCEMANARAKHNDELFGDVLRATLLPALEGKTLTLVEGEV